jgi:DNA-binding MarR family transcriptional regulator
VQRLVDVMNKDELLLFHKNPDHKRAKLIDLTDFGKEIFYKLDEKHSIQANAHSSNIPQKELETTLSVLKQISDTIDR